MKIRVLDKGNKQDIRTFKSIPFALYRENRYWVPPLPGEIETVMDPAKHPFYQHSEGDFLVAEDGKQTLGRIAILQNRNYCEFHKEKTAFFYYYEAVDDQEIAAELFSAAESWARERGLDKLMGPRGFLRSNGAGMLVEGFDQSPAMGIAYNHKYYSKQLEALGYEKYTDYFSGYLDKHPDKSIHKIAEKVLARGNFHVKDFSSTKEIKEWIPRLEEVHHRAFAQNPGYYPSTSEEFLFLVENIVAVANPKYLKIILHEDDIAGFIVSYPDISRALRRTHGNLLPFGWLMLLVERKFSRVLDLNGVGLLPEYQGLGGNAVLYSELDKVLYTSRMKKAEVVQVEERNFRSASDMQTLGVIFNKTHRIYQKTL